MRDITVEIGNVTKRFKGGVEAVKQLDFSVAKGEFFSLLGPSGCGKTTTLRLVAGFVRPSRGAILIDGKDVTHLPPEKRNVGIVFQNYAIFPHMNVYDNIAFGLQLRKLGRKKIDERVKGVLSKVGLSGYEPRYQRELSGGEQQRVALARVLVTEPRILLLDEPLSALDKNMREEMKFWIKDLQQQLDITTLYVTHDQSEALTMSDRLAVMNAGRIEQIGAPREIYENPETRFVTQFIGESNILEGKVRGRNQHGLELELDRVMVTVAVNSDLNPGEAASIVIRPENVELGYQLGDQRNQVLKGKITRRTYEGALIRYEVQVDQHAIIAIKPNALSVRKEFDVGDVVEVGWDPESVSLITHEEEAT